jgi:outer membrane receptor protein involved in Fe transport
MKTQDRGKARFWTVLAGGALAGAMSAAAVGAEGDVEAARAEGPIEEVVVVGRYRSAATDIVSERIDSPVAVDLLDAEGISRLGDSTVAAALRRVTGVTVRDDKFVYVRGLGERYSSTQLNGAAVPSPDLTRNVIPLDLFPADIIDSLAITKGYSPERPAAFGGGDVDIRTTRVPEVPVLSFKVNTGWNSESRSDGLTYAGGRDDKWGNDDGTRQLSGELLDAIATYQGSFAPAAILATLRRDGGQPTLADAEAVNRQLATLLNRDVDLKSKDLPPDLDVELTGGYRWYIGDEFEIGFLAHGAYGRNWRNQERINRRVVSPELNFSVTNQTTDQVSLTGALTLGARYTDDHEIGTFSLALRNTEDRVARSITCQDAQFNDCFSESQPSQGVLYDTRYEQRDLVVNQVTGTHRLGNATLDKLPEALGFLERARDLEFNWYYSDAKAESDIPNETRFGAIELLDPMARQVLVSQIRQTGSSGEYRFSDLEDDVLSHGWDLSLPIYGQRWDLTLATGYDYVRRGRSYTQYSFGLGSTSGGFQSVAAGMPSEVFSDENILDPSTGIGINLGVGGFGTESYLAGQIIDAYYYKFDLMWDSTWRISGGARQEAFQQLAVPLNVMNFQGPRVPLTPEQIRDSAINRDDWFPALAVTWIRPGFWADEFQLRFGWSETAARPDLREISRSSYIDPLTEARVRGNPFLRPSELTNYDLRAEWFWSNGDNFTVSLFYKDISDPIETVQGGATEENILFNFANGESAEVYGVEIEGLKSLGFASRWLGDWTNSFYVAGNVTLSDSDIKIPPGPGVGNVTNESRRLTQHSQWVANLQLGYDSLNGKHGATLAYNAFGERILFAGIDGFDDAFEQPFHSLDLTYSWFATDNLTLKLRLRNLLKDKVEVEQDGVTVIEQNVGMTGLLDIRWAL